MRPVRAVVYGAGAMGLIATRMMAEKGVEVVGAIARSPEKVGRDVGDLAGIGPLGVLVDDEVERVLSTTRPDIVMLATQTFLPEIADKVRASLRHGANVLTIAEEAFFPWETSPDLSAELDALARENGVTVTGGGHQDSFWVHQVSALMGASHSIDSVHGRASWNQDDYGIELLTTKHVGESLAEFETSTQGADAPPTFGRCSLGALARHAGLTVKSWESRVEPVVADTDRFSVGLDRMLEAGTIVGYADVDVLHTVEGPVFTFEMAGYVYGQGDADRNEWTIAGEPDLHLSSGLVPTQITTCTQWVNRIPDVLDAEPGFVTIDQLAPPRYRAGDMRDQLEAPLRT